jgi:hypothetical protein
MGHLGIKKPSGLQVARQSHPRNETKRCARYRAVIKWKRGSTVHRLGGKLIALRQRNKKPS